MPGYDVIMPVASAGKVWGYLGSIGKNQDLRPVGMKALEILRVEAGWPWSGVDFDDNNLLMEALTQDHVSFTKGCYIGQEVVIRIEHRGHLTKRLSGLVVAGEAVPSPGATILSGDRQVGHVTSAVFSPGRNRVIALGYLRREFWDPGTKLRISSEGQPLGAEVVLLPFVSAAGSSA
jgi:folate-binding protein YgfZ